MEDNNTAKATNENKASKPAKEKKDKKKKSIKNILSIYKSEFRKISWPSRDVLIKETITVIVISLLVGVIIFGYDTAFEFIRDKAISVLTNSPK